MKTESTKAETPKNNNFLLVGLIVLLLSAVGIYVNTLNNNREARQEQSNFINSLYDTIITLRKDSMMSVVEIASLNMHSVKQFTDLRIRDEEIARLQSVVKSYGNKLKFGSSVTNTTVTTHIDKTVPNEWIIDSLDSASSSGTITFHTDSTYWFSTNKSNLIVHSTNTNPYFLSKFSDKWINLEIKTFIDSTKAKIDINNSYSVVLGYNGKIPFADVINYNPYSTVTKLRAFMVTVPRQKSWGIGLSTGIGFSYDLKPRPYIGIGVNYNIIKF